MCLGQIIAKEKIMFLFFFFQAEDGIRDLVRSRGLGDVYKRQIPDRQRSFPKSICQDLYSSVLDLHTLFSQCLQLKTLQNQAFLCLLYTSDAADDLLCVDLGGRRIIKNKRTICFPIQEKDYVPIRAHLYIWQDYLLT